MRTVNHAGPIIVISDDSRPLISMISLDCIESPDFRCRADFAINAEWRAGAAKRPALFLITVQPSQFWQTIAQRRWGLIGRASKIGERS